MFIECEDCDHCLMKLEGAWVVFILSLIFSSLVTFGKLLILSTGVAEPLGMDSSSTSQISSEYSRIVRSEEKWPERATQFIERAVHSECSILKAWADYPKGDIKFIAFLTVVGIRIL